jgi:peptidoglycan/xylan/chitin deacetylase (PgdA/CDA1 family)
MVRSADALPKHTLIITFDDAYLSFRTLALPLLKKYGFSATVFVPVAYMGKTNFWDHGSDPIMSETDLRQLAIQEEIEIGLHSFLHGNYGSMTIEEMKDDLKQCRQLLEHHAIPFTNVLAYPYGGYPKKDQVLKRDMIEMFVQQRLDFATRIGNRINSWPIRHPYEIKRIDMKGTDSFYIFKTKLQKGHARLFA